MTPFATQDTAPDESDDVEIRAVLASLSERVAALRASTGGEVSRVEREQLAALSRLRRPGRIRMTDVPGDAQQRLDHDLISASVLFDEDWYRANNEDVMQAGLDPALHYLNHGGSEGRWPGPAFDAAAYLAAHPELGARNLNPLVHFLTIGAPEGWALAPMRAAPTELPYIERTAPLRILADLESLADYHAFAAACPTAFDAATEATIIDHARRCGTTSTFFGTLGPEHTVVAGDDMREHLLSGGVNARVRAVLACLMEIIVELNLTAETARIYGHEAITYLARLMHARFTRFVGSEYAPTEEEQARIFPIVHNDVCASRFADDSFDLMFSLDVLEHVYDRDLLLAEAARTLRPDGAFLATFPFDQDVAHGWLLAKLEGGRIRHLVDEPIYHGNPMTDEGSLVFEIVGWDIIERARRAGFSRAFMRFLCDQEQGIVASAQGRPTAPRGIFVLICRK